GDLASADKLGTELINNASCSDVRGALDALNAAHGGRIYNKEPTRNELVQNLRQATGNTRNPTALTPLAITKYTGQVAARARDCTIFTPTPTLPFGSSEVKPLLSGFGPQIFELSS